MTKPFVVALMRKLSSAGEHSLHRGGVMGSNPIVSTKTQKHLSVTYGHVLGEQAHLRN